MSNGMTPYTVSLSIDYPDRPLNRWTTAFRIVLIVPIAVLYALISGAGWAGHAHAPLSALTAGGMLVLPTLLMILFRRKYPRWWFDWNTQLVRFGLRVSAYFALLDDAYPSTDDDQSVHAVLPYPDAGTELMRGMPLVKWFLAIPHYVVIVCLAVAAEACIIIAWFAILFTGRYPRALFTFVVGVMRWALRVNAYAFLLITDRYPPFSFRE